MKTPQQANLILHHTLKHYGDGTRKVLRNNINDCEARLSAFKLAQINHSITNPQEDWLALLRTEHKIQAIKKVMADTGLSLYDSKQVCDDLIREFRVPGITYLK
jgi:hypothetical protein